MYITGTVPVPIYVVFVESCYQQCSGAVLCQDRDITLCVLCPGLWPQSGSADPDPGGKNLKSKLNKSLEIFHSCNFIKISIENVIKNNFWCCKLFIRYFCTKNYLRILNFDRDPPRNLDPHLEKTAGSGSAKDRCGSTALVLP